MTLFKEPEALALRTEPMVELLPDYAIVTVDNNMGPSFTILGGLEVQLEEADAKWLGVPWNDSASQGPPWGHGPSSLQSADGRPGWRTRALSAQRQRCRAGHDAEALFAITSGELVGGRAGHPVRQAWHQASGDPAHPRELVVAATRSRTET